MLQSLLPMKLNKDDASYQTVKELAEVLDHAIKNKDIRNIALTGPFGSGKSSIIQTLMKEHDEFHYLPISLATLQADEEEKEENDKKKDVEDDKEKWTESLNHKVEYSILQQIIYKEKSEKVPNSRFRRIVHIENNKLIHYSIGCVCFLVAFLIVFEPNFVRVNTICNLLNLGKFNKFFDLLSSIYLLYVFFRFCKYFIKSYANSKLNKLNLKDGDIEIKEENSIFNKHLDEILYFFQVTDYNVVVIEDLDRFETEKIFLKLRELNQLVNESEIVNRHIIFLYAIKDDVFENEARTKFFDYITTVIPVINPSNSKAKLKEALLERGYDDNEIPDDDLSEIAFFIQDMRILTNIANEYSQYRNKLYNPKKNNLNKTKLLAIIVYKNYYPKDFAKLHRRDGQVYHCINSKPKFVAEALKVLDERVAAIENEKSLWENNSHLQETDLRLLFLYNMRNLVEKNMSSVYIDKNDYSLENIANSPNLFNKLMESSSIQYRQYGNYYNPTTNNVNFKRMLSDFNFEKRLKAIRIKDDYFLKKKKEVQNERLVIYRLKVKDLISKYNIETTDLYKNMKLAPLIDVFIRQGYIDEAYYDYISYFYPGMVSLSDRDLLLSMKRNIRQDYTYHIDKIDNFVKELKDYMFEYDSILNNELLDYLSSRKDSHLFTQIMLRIEKENAPLDFLAQYYQYGKRQKEVFTDFINWDKKLSWQMILSHTNEEERQILQEAWLKYCENILPEQETWLKNNYDFLSQRVDIIGLKKCKKIVENITFHKLNNTNKELLDYVIEQWQYDITMDNLCLIINHLNKAIIATPDNLNLTLITKANNEDFENCIKECLQEAIHCFSATCKNESLDSIFFILNSDDVTSEDKISYLKGQQECVPNFNRIKEEAWDVSIQSLIIKPIWNNVGIYYNKKGSLTNELLEYIEHFHKELEIKCSEDVNVKQSLFKDLLCSNKLSVQTFQSVCKAFDLQFNNYKPLSSLDEERLIVLLENDKIAFSAENTAILKETSIYSEYLIYYSSSFIDTLDKSYQLDLKASISLLNSNKFTIHNKRQIINVIDEALIFDSMELADKVVEVLLESNDISMDISFLKKTLQTAEYLPNRVMLVSKMLGTYDFSSTEISSLLKILGRKYIEVAERKKRPVLVDSEENKSLLLQLKRTHFISSTSLVDDGIRVIPPKNKN